MADRRAAERADADVREIYYQCETEGELRERSSDLATRGQACPLAPRRGRR